MISLNWASECLLTEKQNRVQKPKMLQSKNVTPPSITPCLRERWSCDPRDTHYIESCWGKSSAIN